MLRATRKEPLGHLAELNITPLLDLSFVLLVIFMITAPLLGNRNIDLVLPTSESDSTTIPRSNYLSVTVDGQNNLYLEEEPIDARALVEELRNFRLSAQEKNEEIAVVLQADSRLLVSEVIPLLDRIVEAGIVHTALVSKPQQ